MFLYVCKYINNVSKPINLLCNLNQPILDRTQTIQICSTPLHKGNTVGQILKLKTLPLLAKKDPSGGGLPLQALQLVAAGDSHLQDTISRLIQMLSDNFSPSQSPSP